MLFQNNIENRFPYSPKFIWISIVKFIVFKMMLQIFKEFMAIIFFYYWVSCIGGEGIGDLTSKNPYCNPFVVVLFTYFSQDIYVL